MLGIAWSQLVTLSDCACFLVGCTDCIAGRSQGVSYLRSQQVCAALHCTGLHGTKSSAHCLRRHVEAHNDESLLRLGVPLAHIRAQHPIGGQAAKMATAKQALNLLSSLTLAVGAKITLMSNLWTSRGAVRVPFLCVHVARDVSVAACVMGVVIAAGARPLR